MNNMNTNAAKDNQNKPCMKRGTTTQTKMSKKDTASSHRTLRAFPQINRTSTQKIAEWENTFLSVTCGIGVSILCLIVMRAFFLKKASTCQPAFFRVSLHHGQRRHAENNEIINQ